MPARVIPAPMPRRPIQAPIAARMILAQIAAGLTPVPMTGALATTGVIILNSMFVSFTAIIGLDQMLAIYLNN